MTGIATTSTIMISTSVTTTGREAAISGMKTGIADGTSTTGVPVTCVVRPQDMNGANSTVSMSWPTQMG